MKKLLSAVLALSITASLTACGSEKDNSSSSAPETTEPALYQDVTSPARHTQANEPFFGEYVSNTFISTGNNYIVEKADSVTYRAYLPIEEYGELEYCFYFSNTVDSTYDSGIKAYVGLEGGSYTIESAFIGDGGTDPEADSPESRLEVTFDGSQTKEVSPSEVFTSDPITLDIPEGHYLVWEWTLTGENIPANAMSQLTKTESFAKGSSTPGYCDQIPLPVFIGAKRDVKYRVAAIGDSITQGCQTDYMAYEFWAARIAQTLGADYGFYNSGLGWSRASDAAEDGNWLERTANSDIVIVAFGTNDILTGRYGNAKGHADSAEQIDGYLRTILDRLKQSDCGIIVFNAPPEDYKESYETVRTEYNEILRATCEEYQVAYFDFASLLSDESNPAAALYGGHPNGEGGKFVAEAFIGEYSAFLGLE